jgi:hypothetical protein
VNEPDKRVYAGGSMTQVVEVLIAEHGGASTRLRQFGPPSMTTIKY